MPSNPPNPALARRSALDTLLDATALRAPSAPARPPGHVAGVLSRTAASPERPHGDEPLPLGAAFHDAAFDSLIATIRGDARVDARAYLRTTEVPGGGE